MKPERFHAVLLEDHKEGVVEVPFDPAQVWSLATRQLGPGRWGHEVEGTINGVLFESVVLLRSGRFFLVVEDDLQRTAGLLAGGTAQVVLKPRGISPASGRAAAPRPKRRVKERPGGTTG